ncbi:YihY/virulence factor BrkB family protein [Microtetraspora malaysiensis]|uniref:YihY/virulence factor BrkB family protein n=1 Tax=Microtetraspora malaysiensis TaxID=161358 RepID=UPI003D910A62
MTREDPQREPRKAPESPTDLPKKSWFDVLKRTVKEFQRDKVTDRAAALTYYAVLSLFPALLAVVSILGLLGASATKPLMSNVTALAPGPAKQTLGPILQALQGSRPAAGAAAIIGIVVAIWSASGYVAAFIRAANALYDMPEGRPIWVTLPLRVGITAMLIALTAIGMFVVVFTGGLADKAGQVLGIGETGVAIWNVGKWPVLLVLVALVLALLFWLAPNVRQPRFRWLTSGTLLAVIVWIVASLLFALYVAKFGSYNKTYATLAGVVVFLIWLWITNIAILLGVEFDAELARERAIEAGHAPDETPYVDPRGTRKMRKEA